MAKSSKDAGDVITQTQANSPIDNLVADFDSLFANGIVATAHKIVDRCGLDGQNAISAGNFHVPIWVDAVKAMLAFPNQDYLDQCLPGITPQQKAFLNYCRVFGNILQQRDDYPIWAGKFLVEIRAVGVITDQFTGACFAGEFTDKYHGANYNVVNPVVING